MKRHLLHALLGMLLSALIPCDAQSAASVQLRAIPLRTIDGKSTSLNAWDGTVILIVNVASRSKHTPQYAALEALHKKYLKRGFSVLGFPCNDFGGEEPGKAEDIKAFCSTKYHITFPLFEKLRVNGPDRHPLYTALTGPSSPVAGELKANFGKFLISREGAILKRWAADVKPDGREISAAVEAAIFGKPVTTAPLLVRPVTFFDMPSTGNNIIFCINTSGLMRSLAGSDGIVMLRRELRRTISDMTPGASFNIVCYGGAADMFKPASVSATPEVKEEAMRFLDGYYGAGDFGRTRTEQFGPAGKDSQGIGFVPVLPGGMAELRGLEGGCRIDLAMVAAFKQNPTTLYVVSAGLPHIRKEGEPEPLSQEAVITLIHSVYQKPTAGKGRVSLNAVSLFCTSEQGKEGKRFLVSLANKFGGKHREAKPK